MLKSNLTVSVPPAPGPASVEFAPAGCPNPGSAIVLAFANAAPVSGGLKNTGNGDPPIGVPFMAILSFRNEKAKHDLVRSQASKTIANLGNIL